MTRESYEEQKVHRKFQKGTRKISGRYHESTKQGFKI